ncbi:MAG: winged helix-turn-helix transcriptional regulator [Spirochaetales bacterium]|nr:winged helix-turn-helix transcriptional regulator [Spirochaetales bacterium]
MVVSEHPLYKTDQIADRCNLSIPRINQIIKNLKDKDLLERKGSKKSGYWEVK